MFRENAYSGAGTARACVFRFSQRDSGTNRSRPLLESAPGGHPTQISPLSETSDWVRWSNLCILCSTNGCFRVIDPCATNADRRFYRLRLGE